jgi:hypothetical protein
MDKETQFIDSVYAEKGKYDFIVTKLNISADSFKAFLDKNSEYIKNNKGYIGIEVLRTKADRDKFYCKFTPFIPKPKVDAVEHMPDREVKKEEDLPF